MCIHGFGSPGVYTRSNAEPRSHGSRTERKVTTFGHLKVINDRCGNGFRKEVGARCQWVPEEREGRTWTGLTHGVPRFRPGKSTEHLLRGQSSGNAQALPSPGPQPHAVLPSARTTHLRRGSLMCRTFLPPRSWASSRPTIVRACLWNCPFPGIVSFQYLRDRQMSIPHP